MATTADLDKLAGLLEQLTDAWQDMDPETQSQALSAVESAGDLVKPGDDTQSEFQRNAKLYAGLAAGLQVAAVAAGLSVALAPAAPFLSILGVICGVLAAIGKSLTPERTKELSAWLQVKAPKFQAALCENPTMLYGLSYRLNPEGPWYLLHSCSVPEMLTADPSSLSPSQELQDTYPSWTTESTTETPAASSSDTKSLLFKVGLAGVAAYLLS